MSHNGDEVIILDGVYKIFGPQPRGRAFDLLRSGMSKDEVQAETGHVVGLDNVSFSVRRGEVFVVMGLSGSGKSTAMRTVNKLIDITAGQISVAGTDVQALEGSELQAFRRTHMGMVFQHFALFPHRNVIDNVGYGLKVQGVARDKRNAASMRALSLVGLGPYAYNMPAELSGGMQQRVGLARALASDPEILLMDEAFSALDPLIRRQMQDEFLDIQQRLKKSIVFITHDFLEALRIADRMMIMRDGMAVQVGAPADLILNPADDYVAEFTEDVPMVRVLKAADVLDPSQAVADGMPRKDADTSVERVLPLLARHRNGIAAMRDGRPVGVVTAASVIAALAQEKPNRVGSGAPPSKGHGERRTP